VQKAIPAYFKQYLKERQSAKENVRGDGTITWRGIGVGALMCVLIAVGVPYGGMVIQGTRLGLSSSTPAAFFLFFMLLVTLHVALGKIRRGWAFRWGELLTIFSMMVVATAIPTRGVTGLLLPMITGSAYYATPENRWDETLHPFEPKHLLVKDQQAIAEFYEGSGVDHQIPWDVWLSPLAHWLFFYAALYLTLISLLAILRRQWSENERLAYPLAQIPLAMMESGRVNELVKPFFRNGFMWVGFAIPFFFNSLNALHHYDPSFPTVVLRWQWSIFDQTIPLRLWINFLILGFTYLINAKISLSIWFFYLLHMFQERTLVLMGMSSPERSLGQWSEPGMGHQMMGALLVLVAYGLWTGRDHIRDVLRRALGRGGINDADEVVSYRGAVLGALVGMTGMGGWLWYSGLPAWVVPFVIISSLVIFIGLARVVAEAGLPTVTPGMVPAALTVSCIGVPALGAAGLVATSYTLVWIGDMLVFMAAGLANILRLSTEGVQRARRLLGAIGLAMLISLVVSVWFTLYLAYRYGAVNLHAQYFNNFAVEPATFAVRQLADQTTASVDGWLWMGAGGLIMAGLMYARQRFYGWPFHPLGFVTSMGWVMDTIWFSVFLSWLIKGGILRLGGIKSYEKSRFFFMGLALGQIVCGGIWLLIDGITGVVGHRIPVY
jgi:hypothetical protein